MITQVKLPDLPLTGGCQCGQVRYAIKATPYVFYLCHCTECQRHTSSAFGESLWVTWQCLEIVGELRPFYRIAASGNKRQGHFCPNCGTRVVYGTRGSEKATIKAGTLDDTSWLVPAGHIWTGSKQAFVTMAADELAYPGEPSADGYAALAKRWREMLAQN